MAFATTSLPPIALSDPSRSDPVTARRRDDAERELGDKVASQAVDDRSSGQPHYQVTADRVSKLRANLIQWYRQNHTQMTDRQRWQEANQVLTHYFTEGDGQLIRGDVPLSQDVQMELRQEPPTSSSQPDTSGREAPRDTFGSESALARRPGGDVFRPATPQTLTTPQQPTPQATTPQAPAPQASVPQAPASTKTATAPLVPDAPVVPQEAPPSPTGQPVVATGTSLSVSPEAPAPQPGVRMITYGDKPAAGTDHERIPFGREQHVKFQVLTRPPTPGSAPTPQGSGEGGMRLADLLRRPGGSTDSKRGRESVEGRSGGSLDRTFAIGMRRQFRDTAC